MCCPEGWGVLPDGRRCAKVFNSRMSWSGAETACGDLNGHLISIRNAYDTALILGSLTLIMEWVFEKNMDFAKYVHVPFPYLSI